MNPVAIFQHVACETAGTIEQSLGEAGIAFDHIRPFLGDAIPGDPRAFAGLVVMGGPMGVYEADRFGYLCAEIQLLADACRDGVPVLGICLGSQLLATALGARVRPGRAKEIGWHRVRLSPAAASDPLWHDLPDELVPLHWHGDVFDLPEEAVHLGESDLTPVQAFRHGECAYGLLFHLEATPASLGGMIGTFTDELAKTGIDAAMLAEESDRRPPAAAQIGHNVFSRWADLVRSSAEDCKATSNARISHGS